MRQILLGGVGLLVLATAAQPVAAADLPRAPVMKAPVAAPIFNWTGCYAGLNGGWGWGERTVERGATDVTELAASTFSLKPEGAVGGGQIGCNLQSRSLVFGWEADIQGSSIGGRASVDRASGLELTRSTAKHELDWFGTVRARSGFTFTPELLLYVTGGLAYGGLSDRASVRDAGGTGGGFIGIYSDAASGTRIGWTAGGGGELALPHDWSLKAEYLYVDLGDRTLRLTNPFFPGSIIDYQFEHRYHIVRIGLNKKFATGKAPVVTRY